MVCKGMVLKTELYPNWQMNYLITHKFHLINLHQPCIFTPAAGGRKNTIIKNLLGMMNNGFAKIFGVEIMS